MTGGPRVAAIVLAAGSSRRMGAVNKLLAPLHGKPMLRHVMEAVRASRAGEVVVVTGHEPERVRSVVEGLADRVVQNPNHAEGLSTSMIAGLDAVGADVDGVVVCLGDMPRLTAGHIDRLISAFDPGSGHEICVPVHAGQRGNPVLLGRRFFGEMRSVIGDKGARGLLAAHPEAVVEVEMEDDAALHDIDTPEALAAATRPAQER